MLDDQPDNQPDTTGENIEDSTADQGADASAESTKPVVKKTTRKRAPRKTATATPPADGATETPAAETPAAPVVEPAAAAPIDTPAEASAEPAAPVVKKTTRTRTPRKSTGAGAPAAVAPEATETREPASAAETAAEPATTTTAKKATARKTTAKKATAKKATAKKTTASRTTAKKAATTKTPAAAPDEPAPIEDEAAAGTEAGTEATDAGTTPLFQAPEAAPRRTTRTKATTAPAGDTAEDADDEAAEETADETAKATDEPAATAGESATSAEESETPQETSGQDEDGQDGDSGESGGAPRRRRRRGGRRRRKSGNGGGTNGGDAQDGQAGEDADGDRESGDGSGQGSSQKGGTKTAKDDTADHGDKDGDKDGDSGEGEGSGSSRRRRRRRRAGEDGAGSADDPQNTVTRVRQGRSAEDQITSLSGSTRLEAKKQRRREGREAGRRRAPIVSEAEFLARREAVDRSMVIRQRDDLTQIAVLEDKVLVEHYVARESQTSLIGNVYLGRVQNVLPSMEAAFIDIGKGRNAVLYAGEVNWSALGHKEGQPRKIESVLQSGQTVLVQVTKDPIGHKGARLTSQISLAGRFLVYVPDGTTSGISRKLPDTERNRLKKLLKEIVPDTAGVIVRTAAEGASEEELTRDVERLRARWEDIEKKAANKGAGAQLLYGEPDLTLKVVRDLFTEDFSELVIQGDDAWETVQSYVAHVAPDLEERLSKFEPAAEGRDAGKDVFAVRRIEEQIRKGLDRKVWLPSGGSLIIDRTEAMTVVDVNTGKFTGSGGNLEETVTKNNLEAAEEIVRQLRLRDIGGIIVVDFIDMVLESNRDLVVRRLVECLGRDRTRHQVAEVTSLGLVQMTRKRIGTGLLEAFSHSCEHCQGRGVIVEEAPVEPSKRDDEGRRSSRRRGRGKGSDSGSGSGNGSDGSSKGSGNGSGTPSPKDVAAMARAPKPEDSAEEKPSQEKPAEEKPAEDAPAEKPAEQAPVVDKAPEPAPEVDTAVDKVDQAPEPTPEPAAPKVVTRTRRRSATRPAGPPVTPAVSGAGTVPADGGVEPGTAAVEPGTETGTGTQADTQSDTGTESEPVAHVPIKRKGSRKR